MNKIDRRESRATDGEIFTEKEMKNKIRQIDKSRVLTYEVVSASSWGDKSRYELCINTSNLNIKEISPLIAEYVRRWFEGKIT